MGSRDITCTVRARVKPETERWMRPVTEAQEQMRSHGVCAGWDPKRAREKL